MIINELMFAKNIVTPQINFLPLLYIVLSFKLRTAAFLII